MTSTQSFFIICVVPLTLELKIIQDHDQINIWSNKEPSSTKNCYHVGFELAKETPEKMLSKINSIRDEIQTLNGRYSILNLQISQVITATESSL